MKHVVHFNLVFVCLASVVTPGPTYAQDFPKTSTSTQAKTPAPPSDFADPVALFGRISPAVAKLILQDDNKKEISVASAFAVRASEHGRDDCVVTFVTNFHAIRGAPNATLQLDDGETGTVFAVQAEDESVDLAILWARTPKKPSQLVHIEEGPVPPVGTRIFVIGSPKGFKNTLSEGLVSGYRDGAKGSKWVQITAPISPGSSGGPVLTADGQLVGVATASVIDGQNLNFAVPANEVRTLLSADVKHARALWRGTSISRARDEAYLGASYALFAQFSADHPKLDDDGQDAAFKRYRDSKVESGDQLALLLKGYSEYSEKSYENAVRTLTLAAKSKPSEFEYLTHFALAQAHYKIEDAWGKKYSGFDVEATAFLDPTVYSQTVAALLDAKRVNPSFAPALELLVYCYRFTKQFPEALASAELLIQVAPQCSEAYRLRADVYRSLRRHGPALNDFQIAVDLNPNNNSAREFLADTYSSLGEHEKSIGVYEELLARGYEPVWLPYWNMGIEFEAIAKYEGAIAAFEQAIQNLRREDTLYSRTQVPILEERVAQCRARLK